MTSSDWRTKLGQGKRALAQLVRRTSAGSRPPVTQPKTAAGPTGPAAVSRAREQCNAGDTADALRLGYRLLRAEDTAEEGRAVLGLCHLAVSTVAQAWAQFDQLEDPELRAAACPEYAIAGFGVEPDLCAQRCRDLVTHQQNMLTGYTALVLARHAFSVGHEDLARLIADAADAGDFGALTDYWTGEFTRLRSWFSDGSRRAAQSPLPADVRFGVLDYKQPDNSSRNVGDYIQTLASLGHLARQQGLTFAGDPALVAAMNDLRSTVKPERVRSDATATVQLVEVQRDGNVYQNLPDPTWVIMFGWYLHPTFSAGYNLPFHANLRPIFVSFHLNKPDALTDAAIEYLRRWSPVGCRDWQTVALLSAAGVPAFFSGCITTTVDTVFARSGPDTRTGVAYIDAQEAPEDDDQIEQSVGDIRAQPLVANLSLGRAWVERYHSEFAEVITTRLHSYLPARSVGCRVEFQPKNPSDPRFGGLIALDDDAFERIRQALLRNLATVAKRLARGDDESAVYAGWRDLVQPDLAAAESFLATQQFEANPLPPVDLPTLGERVVVVDAPRQSKPLARLLASLAQHLSDAEVVVVGEWAEAGSRDGAHYVSAPLGQGLAVAAVLNALPDHSRTLVLTSDSVLSADSLVLFTAPTSSAGLAAQPDVRRNRQSLSVLIRRVSARQGDNWQRALRFAAAAHRRCGHGAVVPDARVCLIDPAALRAAGWSELAGELIGTFGAGFAEALALVTVGNFLPLPAHSVCRIAEEPQDKDALIVQGAGSARLPLKWL